MKRLHVFDSVGLRQVFSLQDYAMAVPNRRNEFRDAVLSCIGSFADVHSREIGLKQVGPIAVELSSCAARYLLSSGKFVAVRVNMTGAVCRDVGRRQAKWNSDREKNLSVIVLRDRAWDESANKNDPTVQIVHGIEEGHFAARGQVACCVHFTFAV